MSMILRRGALALSVALAGGMGPAAAIAQPSYVEVCDFFGVGWFWVPGSQDTCINPARGETRQLTNTGTVPGTTPLRDDVDKATDAANQARDTADKALEGVALSLALPNATVDPGKTFGLGANFGTFGGKSAFGVSGAVRANDNVTLNGAVGVGLGHGTVGSRAGLNVSW